EAVAHLRRFRIHTRLPIVLPDRVTPELIDLLRSTRLTAFIVIHANHPQAILSDCADALRALVRSGLPVLNHAVLLRGINDSADTLTELCRRLIDLGVIPYYLHPLDRVTGAAHFEVSEATGRRLIEEVRRELPGYAVPQYVRAIPGEPHKSPML